MHHFQAALGAQGVVPMPPGSDIGSGTLLGLGIDWRGCPARGATSKPGSPVLMPNKVMIKLLPLKLQVGFIRHTWRLQAKLALVF